MRGSDLDACLAAAMRGRPTRWPPEANDAAGVDDAIRRVSFHGIAGLLVAGKPDLSGWPEQVVEAIREEARLQAVWDAVHREAIARVLAALHDEQVSALVLKGTALAFSVYDEPSERRRADTDLLVRRGDVDRARKVLARLGWRVAERATFQEVWTLGSGGFDHQVDLHWRLRDMLHEPPELSADACVSRSVPLSRLHAAARTTDPATTLVNCALNHAAHRVYGYGAGVQAEPLHLGGVADTDRLVRSWTAAEWGHALDLARDIRAARALAAALGQARVWLDTAVPPWVLARLDVLVADEADSPDPWSEPPDGPSIARLGAKVRAAAGWRAKRDVALGRLLPSPAELGLPAEDAQRVGPLLRARLARLVRIARRLVAGRG